MTQALIKASTGLATLLLEEQGNFQPHSAWLGVTTSEKTYPDDKIILYAQTIAPLVAKMYVFIADHVQIYNRIPFSSSGWRLINSDEYKKLALKRKTVLEDKLRGTTNVSVALMDADCIEYVHQGEREEIFNLDYTWQLLGNTRLYGPDFSKSVQEKQIERWVRKSFDEKIPLTEASVMLGLGDGKKLSPFETDILQVTEYQAQHLLERLPKEASREEALRCLSFYTQYQLFLTYLLAQKNIAPIKVGSLTEKKYDDMVLKLISGEYGKYLKNPSINFGGLYLEYKLTPLL